MGAQQDWERVWLAELSSGLGREVGQEIRRAVMEESDGLSSESGF